MTFRIRLSLTAAALALAACSTGPVAPAAPPPRLVVFLVIDGLPMRQVMDYRDQLAADGFARFLARGAWFSNTHYPYAFTVTAAGHATMLTGATPSRTGIIGNEWRDIRTGDAVYNTGDTAHTYIGHKTNALDGTSPRNLKAETVGDVLRRVKPASRVIGISGKDRGAILPAGHTGTAYMYMGQTGQFASTTYYMKEHPAWVKAYNDARPADRYFKTEWKPLLPEAAYARSVPDSQPWFGPRGGKLPMLMGVAADDKPGPAFYNALLRSPFADALALDFARAAIAGEQLGQDDAPDILSVSLSGHDYVNHTWSAESRISHDHLLQLDRLLEAFFRDLDAKVGRDNYLAVLTADHGFMPAVEVVQSRGHNAGRASGTQLLGRVNAAVEKELGVPKAVRFISASGLALDRLAITAAGKDFDAVADAVRRHISAEPFIAAAYTRRELESNSRAGAPYFDAMRRSWHKDLSADVQMALAPHWMFGSSSSIATHGSPHPYDTHVPLLFWGPKWVAPGERKARAEVVDIAPTLAGLLGVPVPALSEGKALALGR
ncbi:alkaline phosphatase family protein [Ramlibacter sp.]|uniref:alkaline phosphatase family protein n=1 Tax=Ramlibacter sp. TaxID=1917967 RepID=UPI0035B20BC8